MGSAAQLLRRPRAFHRGPRVVGWRVPELLAARGAEEPAALVPVARIQAVVASRVVAAANLTTNAHAASLIAVASRVATAMQ